MSSVGEQKVQDGSLKRELGERHIRLMALGACIGVGPVSYTHLHGNLHG